MSKNESPLVKALAIAVGALLVMVGLSMFITPLTSKNYSNINVGNPPNFIEIQPDGTIIFHGTANVGSNMPMNHNYIIESDFTHWLDFTVEPGVTDEILNIVPAGVCLQDRHYHRLTLGTSGTPGTDKFFNMTLTDGSNELFLSLTAAETSGWSTTTEFDWDASDETLTLEYSQTAGGGVTNTFVTIKYHYKENE